MANAIFSPARMPILLPIKRGISKKNIPFLTWAAIRGGISIALALALPDSPAKPVIGNSSFPGFHAVPNITSNSGNNLQKFLLKCCGSSE